MFGQQETIKQKNFCIYLVESSTNRVKETYKTGIENLVDILISQAESRLSSLGNGYYLATNKQTIAKEYNLKLLEIKPK